MVPVYIVTGLLESGKTSFIKDTLMEQDWLEKGTTLLIQCEEGEFELEPAYCEARGIKIIPVEDMSEFTAEFCEDCIKKYSPKQMIVEFNGMWNLQDFLNLDFPKSWGLAGIYSTVNGAELELMMTNMRQIFMNQLIESDLVVINRCSKEMNRATFRKALKLQNPNAQLIFEAVDGSLIEFSEEDLPYDISGDTIRVDSIDYGTWYQDAYENPERYMRKKIVYLAQLYRPIGMPKNMFVPGRNIMACCANDVRFYGFPCKTDTRIQFAQKSWYEVTVEFGMERRKNSPEVNPMLRLVSMTPAPAGEEVVSL